MLYLRHIEKVHRFVIRWYCCHECPIRYRKSYRLTRHLIDAHHLQWLSGHKRFQYILEDDGCYRLQTVRYEAVDDSSAISKESHSFEKTDREEEISTVYQQKVLFFISENNIRFRSKQHKIISISINKFGAA